MSSSEWVRPYPAADATIPDTHRALAAQFYSRAAVSSSESIKRGARARLHEELSAKHASLAAQHAQNAVLHIVLADRLLLALGQPPHLHEHGQRAREHRARAAGHHASARHTSALADEYADMAALERVAANQHAILALQSGDAARTHLDIAATAMRHAAIACLVHPGDGEGKQGGGEGGGE